MAECGEKVSGRQLDEVSETREQEGKENQGKEDLRGADPSLLMIRMFLCSVRGQCGI